MAQPAPPTVRGAGEVKPGPEVAPLLEYAKFLRDEEKAHREYLEKLYLATAAVLTVLVGGGMALVGFFHFKTRKEVVEAVEAQFDATVRKNLNRSMARFEKQLAEVNRTAMEKVDRLIEDLQSQIATMAAGLKLTEDAQKDEPAPVGGRPVFEGNELTVLRLMGDSKYSFRTFIGIATDARKQNITADEVTQSLEGLSRKGLIGKTIGKTGGDRWYVTEAGRRYLLSEPSRV